MDADGIFFPGELVNSNLVIRDVAEEPSLFVGLLERGLLKREVGFAQAFGDAPPLSRAPSPQWRNMD